MPAAKRTSGRGESMSSLRTSMCRCSNVGWVVKICEYASELWVLLLLLFVSFPHISSPTSTRDTRPRQSIARARHTFRSSSARRTAQSLEFDNLALIPDRHGRARLAVPVALRHDDIKANSSRRAAKGRRCENVTAWVRCSPLAHPFRPRKLGTWYVGLLSCSLSRCADLEAARGISRRQNTRTRSLRTGRLSASNPHTPTHTHRPVLLCVLSEGT